MHVIGQDDPCNYSERPFGFRESNRLAQEVDLSNKQIAPPICESNGEKDRDAGKFGATVIGHAPTI
jgi:hypothetical protein